jgi:hypothetical protein
MAYKPQLRAAIENIRLGGEAKIWNCESEIYSRFSIPHFRTNTKIDVLETTTGEARALSYPGSPTTFKTTDSAN